MQKSQWKHRDCAVCDVKATTEYRSVLDKEIRPYCHLCRQKRAEPKELLKQAVLDMTYESLPTHLRDVITVLAGDGSYVQAATWAYQVQCEALTDWTDEEIEDESRTLAVFERIQMVNEGKQPIVRKWSLLGSLIEKMIKRFNLGK